MVQRDQGAVQVQRKQGTVQARWNHVWCGGVEVLFRLGGTEVRFRFSESQAQLSDVHCTLYKYPLLYIYFRCLRHSLNIDNGSKNKDDKI